MAKRKTSEKKQEPIAQPEKGRSHSTQRPFYDEMDADAVPVAAPASGRTSPTPMTQGQQDRIARTSPNIADIPLYPPEQLATPPAEAVAQQQLDPGGLQAPKGTMPRKASTQATAAAQLQQPIPEEATHPEVVAEATEKTPEEQGSEQRQDVQEAQKEQLDQEMTQTREHKKEQEKAQHEQVQEEVDQQKDVQEETKMEEKNQKEVTQQKEENVKEKEQMKASEKSDRQQQRQALKK